MEIWAEASCTKRTGQQHERAGVPHLRLSAEYAYRYATTAAEARAGRPPDVQGCAQWLIRNLRIGVEPALVSLPLTSRDFRTDALAQATVLRILETGFKKTADAPGKQMTCASLNIPRAVRGSGILGIARPARLRRVHVLIAG